MEFLKKVEKFLTDQKDTFPVNLLVGMLEVLNLWLPNESPNRVNIGTFPPRDKNE